MPEILLIEDEQVLIDVLKKRLTKEGYEVKIAKNGEQGLELIKNNDPDLVLLDIVMPKMDGFEVLEELNKDPELSEVSVIIISNSGEPVELEKVKELGAEDWVIKTEFNPQDVVNKVEKQLNS